MSLHTPEEASAAPASPALRVAFCFLRCTPCILLFLFYFLLFDLWRRFATCLICSLVAEFRADGLRASHYFAGCRLLITLVIRGKFILFTNCVLAPRALLKFVSSSLFAYCETTAGFTTVGHATIFRVCTFWWVSTHCGAAGTFSDRNTTRGRHPGSATLSTASPR